MFQQRAVGDESAGEMPVVIVYVVGTILLFWIRTGSSVPATRCHPADHICEGRCPEMPPGIDLPPEGEGLCFRDMETDVCVCWLSNTDTHLHLQTLFKCEVAKNGTVKHVMCLPPPICFPPGPGPGCMIVLRCPCRTDPRGARLGRWQSSIALILRSNMPVQPALAPSDNKEQETSGEQPGLADTREFSVKHLLFLLAFVIAPLLCWCLLTFFHEGKCRKKRRTPESEPMATERVEEVEPLPLPPGPACAAPTAPKLESPPPYREAIEPGESCLLAADCGPPPSYEDAVRDPRWRIQEVDSE